MLDFNAPEFLVVAIVALLVIGPKELPRALHFLGKWVGRARGVARQFRSGFDTMVREVELAELEKQWAAENERIMRENPVQSLAAPDEAQEASQPDSDAAQLVARPDIVDVDSSGAPAAEDVDGEQPASKENSPESSKAKVKPKDVSADGAPAE